LANGAGDDPQQVGKGWVLSSSSTEESGELSEPDEGRPGRSSTGNGTVWSALMTDRPTADTRSGMAFVRGVFR
jgi:hypothetical protein